MGVKEVKRYTVSCDGDGCPHDMMDNFRRRAEYWTPEEAREEARKHGWKIYPGNVMLCEDCAAEL